MAGPVEAGPVGGPVGEGGGGTLTAWRLTKARYADTALSGLGSTLRGGRWHARGRAVVYAASSAALALVETLVHVERADLLRDPYVVVPLVVPLGLVERLDPDALAPDGQAWPHPASAQAVGTAWFDERRSAVLVVPSAVVPHETNVLLNPLHPAFHAVAAGAPEPFPIDVRLGVL